MTASAFSQVTIGSPGGKLIAPATQIIDTSISADPQDVLVFNTSTSVTVYLMQTNDYQAIDAGSGNISPLGPQQSIVFNGELNVFAVCGAGLSAVLNLYPSATNYTPYTGVTSIFTGGSVSGVPAAFNVAANSTSTPVNLADVSQYASYDLSYYLGDPNQATASHALAVEIDVQWFDDTVSGIPVFQETWFPWVGQVIPPANAQSGSVACGPMHGHYMTISITNYSVAAVEFAWFNLFGSPRTLSVSDWRQNVHANPPKDHTAHTVNSTNQSNGFDNILLDAVGALTAGLAYLFPLNLYSGPVSIFYYAESVGQTAYLYDIGSSGTDYESGNLPTGPPGSPGLIQQFTAGATLSNLSSLLLPRSACAILIPNAVAGNVQFKVTAQQGP